MDCSPRDSPGQDTRMGCHTLLQGIFPTQGSNPGLLHCRWILYQLNHKGSPRILEWVAYPFSSSLPGPEIESGSPALQADSLPAEPPGKPDRNKVHSKCNALESSPDYPTLPAPHHLWENCLPQKQSLVPRKLGTAKRLRNSLKLCKISQGSL